MASTLQLTDSAATFHSDMVGAICYMASGKNAGLGREIAGVDSSGVYPTLQVADNEFATAQADPGLTHTVAIADVNDLQDMSNDLTANYYLTGDIDASATSSWNGGAGFEPIGFGIGNVFTGTLDGCGYTITGLYINRPQNSNCGLIGVMEGGTIANVTLTDAEVHGHKETGVLVGQAGCNGDSILIQNCHVSDSLVVASSGSWNIPAGSNLTSSYGGLVGQGIASGIAYGESLHIYDCTVDTVTINDDDCAAGSPSQVGGLIGDASSIVIANCRAIDMTFVNCSGGGLIGVADSSEEIQITDCAAIITSSTGGEFAGFIWLFDASGASSYIRRCSTRGVITAPDNVDAAGFIGYGESGTGEEITDCYSWVTLNSVAGSLDICAGFVGTFDTTAAITNCYSAQVITSSAQYTYGFSGYYYTGVFPDYDGADFVACFWDEEIAGITEVTRTGYGAGDGHDTAWMTTQANYEAAGWDFDTVWEMNPDSPAVIWWSDLAIKNILTFTKPFPYPVEAGDRYSISPVPYRLRLWPLQDEQVSRFNRWTIVAGGIKARDLSGFTGNPNSYFRLGAYRGSKPTWESRYVYPPVSSNPSESVEAVNLDGVMLSPFVEQIATGVMFEVTDCEFALTETDSRNVTAKY